MALPEPRLDITNFLISTPSHFVGEYQNDVFRLRKVNQNTQISKYSPSPEERNYTNYIEIEVVTPKYEGGTIFVPDYSNIGENFCIALSVMFGKRFEFNGLLKQHGRPYVPHIINHDTLYNKVLSFNSSNVRADYSADLNLDNVRFIENVLLNQDSDKCNSQSTFFYAGRFYIQALRSVESNPEIAFLSLITAGEILSDTSNFAVQELLDDETLNLLIQLGEFGEAGQKLKEKVLKRFMGLSEKFCLHILDSLDDGFFERTEASSEFEKITASDIKQRLKAVYNLRSKYIHAGSTPSSWMAINHYRTNQEVISGTPKIKDKSMKNSIKRSPTFIGLERIIRYSIIKFIIKKELISPDIESLNQTGKVS